MLPRSEPSLRMIDVSDDIAVATFANVVFVHFRGKTDASCVTSIRRGIRSLLPARPVFFAVIETKSDPPDQAARQGFAKIFEDHNDELALAVVVIRGQGFRAAMVRTIAAGVLTIMPRFRVRFPKHIGGSLEEAAHAAVEHAPETDAASIVRAFGQLADRKLASF